MTVALDPPLPDDSRPANPWLAILVGFAIIAMIVAGVWKIIDHGAAGYYEFSPGTAPRITDSATCEAKRAGGMLVLPGGTPCARIVVPAGLSHTIDGSLYMVDVLVGPATTVEYVLSKLGLLGTFESGMQLVPKVNVLGNTPASQLPCQDAQQMQGATSGAAVVALRRLGYSVRENDLGAQIIQVDTGTAASAAGLQCNDVVTAVNSVPVHTDVELGSAIRSFKPGEVVRVTARRVGANGKSQTVTVSVRLGSANAVVNGKPVRVTFLGVASQTQTTFTLPVDVTIEVGDIGGPSAGLALTLGILDVLSDGNLTGGHKVAATGTIGLDGKVGDVGGVAQKTIAVRRAGAQVFLVPPQELQAAKSEAGSMKVYAVSTLEQALNDLKALGGHIPTPTSAPNGTG